MSIPLSKLLLRYLVFVGIPFVIARRLEKFMMNRLSPEVKAKLNEELKRFPDTEVQKFPDIEDVSENTRNSLDNRGGADPITVWLAKILVVDFGIKAAIAGGLGASIWSGTADTAAASIAKYGSAILSAPGKNKKLVRFVNKLRGIDPKYDDIKAVLLDNQLSVSDKLEVLKIKIEQTVKELKGVKRTKFILFVIATLLFFFGSGKLLPPGTNTAFAALMERLRALLGINDADENIRKTLIEVYYEYNAPLPNELIPEEKIPQAIKDAINGIE